MRRLSIVLFTVLLTIGCLAVVGCGNSPVVEESTKEESAEKNVEGVYVWEIDAPESITGSETTTFTLILKPDKSVAITSTSSVEPDYGTYTVEDDTVRIAWDDGKSVSHHTIVDGNLVDEQSNVWIKQ